MIILILFQQSRLTIQQDRTVTNKHQAMAELHLEVPDPVAVHLDHTHMPAVGEGLHTHMLAVDEGPGTNGLSLVLLSA